MKKSLFFVLIIPFILMGEDLRQLIELSKNNKMLESSRVALQGTKKTYESVESSYLPQFKLGAKYALTGNERIASPRNMSSIIGSVDYLIYDGGKKYHIYDSYKATIKGQKDDLVSQTNQIALQVTNYYFTYLSLVAQRDVKLKKIEQLKAQYSRLKKFFDAGLTTQYQVKKILALIESENFNLHQIELDMQTVLNNLEYIVGRAVSIDKGSLIAQYNLDGKKTRADILALEYKLKSLLANAKAEKSGTLPTIAFNDTYAKNDLDYKNNSNPSFRDDDYYQNIASLNLSWKIFDFGSTSKAYQAAYKKYLALKSQYEYAKNKADIDLKLALKACNAAKLKIKSARAALSAASSSYDELKAKYKNGVIDNILYLEGVNLKYNTKGMLKMAIYDLEIKKANVIYYSGENIEEYIR